MSGKRGNGGDNPWVKPQPDEEPADDGPGLPASPWDRAVPSPWDTPGVSPGTGGEPAQDSSAAWGDRVGPPSLRRPPPTPKRPAVPRIVIPIAAGVVVLALLAFAVVLLTGGDDEAVPPPSPSPTVAVTTPAPPTYKPPPNAIAVQFGVSVVPVDGWSLLAKETKGKELVAYGPNNEARAFFWVRQREKISARDYLIRIVEGETANETAQLGNVRNLTCPRDVLVECTAISYTATTRNGPVRGFVEAYRRKDGVVTAIDFRTRPDFARKAEADAATMRKSVIDSL